MWLEPEEFCGFGENWWKQENSNNKISDKVKKTQQYDLCGSLPGSFLYQLFHLLLERILSWTFLEAKNL